MDCKLKRGLTETVFRSDGLHIDFPVISLSLCRGRYAGPA
jgi:hypothetical protein